MIRHGKTLAGRLSRRCPPHQATDWAIGRGA